MWITSDATGEKAALIITKTHALKNPANASKITLQRTSMLAKTPLSGKTISQFTPTHHTPPAASPAVSTDNTVFAAICEQRKDIDRINAAMNRLESDMLEFKSFMGEIRQKLDEARPARSSRSSPILGSAFGEAEQPGGLPSVELKTSEVEELRAELRYIQSRMKELENSTQRTAVENLRLSAPSAPSDNQPTRQQVIGGKEIGVASQKRSHDQRNKNRENEAKGGSEPLFPSTPLSSRRKRQYYQISNDDVLHLGGENLETLPPRSSFTMHSFATTATLAGDSQEPMFEIPPSHPQSPDLSTSFSSTRPDLTTSFSTIRWDPTASFSTIRREPSPILGNNEPTTEITTPRGEIITKNPSPDLEDIIQRQIEDSFQEASQPCSLPVDQSFFAREVPSSPEPSLPPNTPVHRRVGRPRRAKNNLLTSTMLNSLPADDLSDASTGRSLRRRRSTINAGAPRMLGDKDKDGHGIAKENWASEFAVEIEVVVNKTIPITNGEEESGWKRSRSRRNTRSSRRTSVDLDEMDMEKRGEEGEPNPTTRGEEESGRRRSRSRRNTRSSRRTSVDLDEEGETIVAQENRNEMSTKRRKGAAR
jgi:uncharacterized coiled-coil protein SlyX